MNIVVGREQSEKRQRRNGINFKIVEHLLLGHFALTTDGHFALQFLLCVYFFFI